MRPDRKQIVKSALWTVIGILPGLALCLIFSTPMYLAVTFLGGFVGFGLSLPSTSAARVARLGAAAVIAKNIPASKGVVNELLAPDTEVDQAPTKQAGMQADANAVSMERNSHGRELRIFGGLVLGLLIFLVRVGYRSAENAQRQTAPGAAWPSADIQQPQTEEAKARAERDQEIDEGLRKLFETPPDSGTASAD